MADGDTQTDAVKSGEDTHSSDSAGSQKVDINQIVRDRLARERKKWESRLPQIAEEAIAAWREEMGLTDEVLEKISDTDKTSAELKKLQKELKQYQKQTET